MPLLVHERLATTALIYLLVLSLWGFWRFARGEGVDGSYLGALAIGEGLLVVEALVGVLLYGGGARLERSGLHILYGITAVISIPAFYAFLRGRDGRSEMLMWAFMTLFVWGLTVRLSVTGQ